MFFIGHAALPALKQGSNVADDIFVHTARLLK
jgi:hypothetical protein